MTEPKDLLLVIEHLRRSNRRWKALALAACAVLFLLAIVGYVRTERQRAQAEAAFQAANAALAEAQWAARHGQPR
jgi:hypothetical protein